MGALADLWSSERGLVALALIVGATVLAAVKIITVDQWTDYTKWIFVTYAASKTVTGTATIIKKAGVATGTQDSPPTGGTTVNATSPPPTKKDP
jgi:hypothetical protein